MILLLVYHTMCIVYKNKENESANIKLEELYPNRDDSKAMEFLSSLLVQNLEHARHLEIERLTFNSFYMVLVGGVMALLMSITSKIIILIGSIAMTVLSFINFLISLRWQNVFEQHMKRAESLYKILHNYYFENGIPFLPEEHKGGVGKGGVDKDGVKTDKVDNITGVPAYCFNPLKMKCCSKECSELYRCKTLFKIFNIIFILIFWNISIYCLFTGCLLISLMVVSSLIIGYISFFKF